MPNVWFDGPKADFHRTVGVCRTKDSGYSAALGRKEEISDTGDVVLSSRYRRTFYLSASLLTLGLANLGCGTTDDPPSDETPSEEKGPEDAEATEPDAEDTNQTSTSNGIESEETQASTDSESSGGDGTHSSPDGSPSDTATDTEQDSTQDPNDCPGTIPKGPKDCEATTLEGKLRCIPGLTVKTKDGGKTFDLRLEQPINHADKSAGTFTQRLHLRHVDANAPLVLQTSGYSLSTRRSELAQRFRSNVLSVEHRYFRSSTPKAPADWTQLNIKNSAADFHRIYLALKWLYPKPWVSTGASKGGETVLFHRRFHPCDVDGTVAYVAPLVMGRGDERFVDFLKTVGGDKLAQCREDLRAFQKMALRRRKAILSRMKDAEFQILGGPAVAMEHAILELPWVFFQYRSPASCGSIPDKNASDQNVFDYLNQVGQLKQFKDKSMGAYEAYYYQAANELGVPACAQDHLGGRLQHGDTCDINTYIPQHNVTFDPKAMPKIQDWVKTNGHRLMFLYGSLDPWTAAQVELGNAKDSFKFTVKGKNHNAILGDLPSKQKSEALNAISRWIKAQPRQLRSAVSRAWIQDSTRRRF